MLDTIKNTTTSVDVKPQSTAADSYAIPGFHRRSLGMDYGRQLLWSTTPQLVCDAFAIAGSLLLAFGLVSFLPIEINYFPAFAVCATLSMIGCNFANGLYPGLGLHPADELRLVVRSTTLCVILLAMGLIAATTIYSPYAQILIVSLPCLWLSSVVSRGVSRSLSKRLGISIPFFFLGDRHKVMRAYRNMKRFGWNLLTPVGRFDFESSREQAPLHILPMSEMEELSFERDVIYQGTSIDIPMLAMRSKVYWLFVVREGQNIDCLRQEQAIVSFFPQVIYLDDPSLQEFSAGAVTNVGAASGIRVEEKLLLPSARITKRLIDVLVTSVALVFLCPLFLLISLLVKCSGRGPVFYFHERIGLEGRRIHAWKFRSMVQNADQILEEFLQQHPELQLEWQRDHKLKNDPRITTIGKILRKTSLDELPQLWNVLIGEMSLVGPRPIVQSEIEKYGPTFADYLRVTPGITGLWQISGRNNTSYAERLQLDSHYVRNWSPWFDMYILLRTIKTVLFCEGAY